MQGTLYRGLQILGLEGICVVFYRMDLLVKIGIKNNEGMKNIHLFNTCFKTV